MDILNTLTININHENYIFAYLSVFISIIFIIPLPHFNRIFLSLKNFKFINKILLNSLNFDILISFSIVSFLFFKSTMLISHLIAYKDFVIIEKQLTPLLEFFINLSLLIVPYSILKIKLYLNLNILIGYGKKCFKNLPDKISFTNLKLLFIGIVDTYALYWCWLFISVSYHFYFKTFNTIVILFTPIMLSLALFESTIPALFNKCWRPQIVK